MLNISQQSDREVEIRKEFLGQTEKLDIKAAQWSFCVVNDKKYASSLIR